MATDVNWIMLSLDGRIEMLGTIFGDGKQTPERRPVTAEGFKAFVAHHNRRYGAGGRKRGRK
jgi:hypothetical protein